MVATARTASGSMSATFVDFAPLRDGGLVAQALLNALGLDERGGQPILARVATYLGSRHHLFVFDNCEHVVQAAAQLADELLRVCPGAQVLATSREVLGVPSEVVWRVRPLTVPPRFTALAIGSLGELESVRLFVERARLAKHDFALDETNVGWVVEICQRLDGIPLALELAAARLRLLPLKQIAAGMDWQLRLLGGGNRLSATRQHTLRATFNWSYGLLTGAEQALFRRLAVFTDGFTLQATEGVCSGEGVPSEAVLDHLAALVDKSLVLSGSDQDEGRYRLLAPVRSTLLSSSRRYWKQGRSSGDIETISSISPSVPGANSLAVTSSSGSTDWRQTGTTCAQRWSGVATSQTEPKPSSASRRRWGTSGLCAVQPMRVNTG